MEDTPTRRSANEGCCGPPQPNHRLYQLLTRPQWPDRRGSRVCVRALSESGVIVRFWPTLAPSAKSHRRNGRSLARAAAIGWARLAMSVDREFESLLLRQRLLLPC